MQFSVIKKKVVFDALDCIEIKSTSLYIMTSNYRKSPGTGIISVIMKLQILFIAFKQHEDLFDLSGKENTVCKPSYISILVQPHP